MVRSGSFQNRNPEEAKTLYRSLQFLVCPLISTLQYCESCLFRITDRERLGDRRRTDASRNQLFYGILTQGAFLQRRTTDRTTQLEAFATDTTALFWIGADILVDRHEKRSRFEGNSQLSCKKNDEASAGSSNPCEANHNKKAESDSTLLFIIEKMKRPITNSTW